jgi:hypothetical protein
LSGKDLPYKMESGETNGLNYPSCRFLLFSYFLDWSK